MSMETMMITMKAVMLTDREGEKKLIDDDVEGDLINERERGGGAM